MLIHRAGKVAAVALLVMALSACSWFGGKAKQEEEAAKQKTGQSKAQSTGDQSIINQELKKQYDIYHEMLQYRREQEAKMTKQAEERYKKLKEESNKSNTKSNTQSDSKSSGTDDDTSKQDSDSESGSDS